METKGGRLECYCFWFPDRWLFGRTQYVVSSPRPVMAYSRRLNARWPKVCFWFSSGLRHSLGCVRGRWCLGFQDHERQHSPPTPTLTRKHATTAVMIVVPCFLPEHRYRFLLSHTYTYSGLSLMHLYSFPGPPHLNGIGSLGWTLLT
jgi:hypothetical protein